MTGYADTHSNSLGWLLDRQLAGVPGVQGALLISSDGLLSSRTATLRQEGAEKLAAVTAALRAVALSYAEVSGGGGVRQVVIETDARLYPVTRARHNMLLGVETTALDVDVEAITEEMLRLADRVHDEMTVADRQTVTEAPER
ncbi:roadblock/LC7 domain-containing protein [Streptomyces sp. BE133]|uniref:roadblock/LC7 domain-containing protein n=1 Tax=Streptomyces sp. BE133 TaxID=3002523 RepID=UPI002E769CF3|nr:roadblock/LC7 domain-containing protein [Streptomyces sp. BE133]MEE1808206.1 roadblock/LC7 domain-containing protein [Streptomyces sp. BE133]